jgi:cytochrome c peroxidase
MTNEYYKLLLSEKWNLRKWKGPIQYEDAKTKSISEFHCRIPPFE